MSDLTGPENQQIRDRTYPVPSESLQTAGAEPVPEEIIRDLLVWQWVATQVAPKPAIIVKGDAQQTDGGDWIVVSIDDYKEIPHGHRGEFVDIEIPMRLAVYSKHSRLRMWSLMAETRRILYRWMLALQPYQRITIDSWQPEYIGPNNHQGNFSITLSAGAIGIFIRHASGETAPNTEPEDFPRGL